MFWSLLLILAVAIILKVVTGLPLSDLVNGTLESCGGLFIYMSIRDLYRAKLVRGVSWKHVAFFSTWGVWNLWYYPELGQWFSFAGGVFLCATNTFWLGQIAYYLVKEKKSHAFIH